MTNEELEKQIAKARIHPAYLFFGEEQFLLERALKKLVAAAVNGGDPSFNCHAFWPAEKKEQQKARTSEIVAAANAFPVLAPRRVVVVRDAEKMYGDETLARYLANPAPECVLILVAPDGGKSGKKRAAKDAKPADLVSLMKSTSNAWHADTAVEFKPLGPAALTAWITGELAALGKRISPDLCVLIQAIKGNDLREISSELEKLDVAFAGKKEITEADILQLLGDSKEFTVWELSTAVMNQDAAAAQAILGRIVETDARFLVVPTLTRQLSTLWRIWAAPPKGPVTNADAHAIGLPGIWQYNEIRKSVSKIRRPDYFEACFTALAEADLDLKSTTTDDRITLTRLIHRLTR